MNGMEVTMDIFLTELFVGRGAFARRVFVEHADEAHDHSGELPVYLFRAADVTLHGFEAQLIWQFAPAWRWTRA